MLSRLKQIIESGNNIVFFGGAGVSTESGIPDFRGVDGLYRQKYAHPPEVVLSHSFFMEHPAEFFDFYRDKMLFLHARPNKAHAALAHLEQAGKLRAVITQNIDGLHQAAGSKCVLELHGSVHRNFCMGCNKPYGVEHILSCTGVPRCGCGGVIKPDVVLYGEPLCDAVVTGAISHIRSADVLIIGGTSLGVYPAAGLTNHYSGDRLVLINMTATPADSRADLIIREPIGEVLGVVV